MTDAAAAGVRRAARAGTLIGLAQLAAYAASFVLGVLVAATFGVARATDAYFMATSTAELLAKLLLGSTVASLFLPLFVQQLTAGQPDRAWRLFRNLFGLACVAFVVLGGLLELAAGPLVAFLAPGFAPETTAATVVLLRIVFPAYLLAFLADLAIAPLHAHRTFGPPAASRVVVPLTTILLLLALAGKIGVAALAVGTLLGTALQLTLLVPVLRRVGLPRGPWWPRVDADVRRVLLLALPFILSVLAADGAGVVYRILVSHQPEGSLASLKFAEKIFSLSNTLFLQTIAVVSFPAFAAAAALSARDAKERLATAARFVTFLALPLTVGLVLLREPLVRLLYERGAFGADATAATAALVPLYVIGLLGNGWSSLLGHLALAFQAARTTVAVNVALQAIAAALFVLLVPRYGVAGLAAASGIGPFVLTGLYLIGLRARVPQLPTALVSVRLLPLLLASAGCAVAVQAARLGAPGAGVVHDVVQLVGGGLAGAAAYLGIAWLLDVPEVRTLRSLLTQRLRPRPV